MDTNYPMRVYPCKNGESLDWVAEFPDLQGCIGVGDTIEEAINEANIFKELWLEDAIKSKESIPSPSAAYFNDYSGKFNLRIPKSLHRELALKAEFDGVSLNTYCIMLLSQHDKHEKCDHTPDKAYSVSGEKPVADVLNKKYAPLVEKMRDIGSR